MKIIENLLTKNDCYKKSERITPKGIVLHSIGVNQPSAKVLCNNFNKPNYEACVHAFIDANNGEVYQCLPWNMRGWHVGGAANNTHIGIEMCEPSQIKYTGGASFTCSNRDEAIKAVDTAYAAAVELCAYLCKQYGLNPLSDGVIISHSEAHKRGIGSNHADCEHLWNGLKSGYTMNGFRNAVANALKGTQTITNKLYRVQVGAFRYKKNAEELVKKLKKIGYDAFIKEE